MGKYRSLHKIRQGGPARKHQDKPYESETIALYGDGYKLYYTPDIKIGPNQFIEVKGWETNNAKKKARLMGQQRQDIQIIYIREPEYRELAQIFRDVVSWEKSPKHGY